MKTYEYIKNGFNYSKINNFEPKFKWRKFILEWKIYQIFVMKNTTNYVFSDNQIIYLHIDIFLKKFEKKNKFCMN